MVRILVLLSLVLLCVKGIAENAELDSLLKVLNEAPNRDSLRVDRLIDVHGHLILSDASATLPYVEEAMSIAKEIGYIEGIGFCENAMGMYHFYHHENKEKALEHVLRSVQILDSIGDQKHILVSYNNLGLIYQRLKRYEDSQVIYEKLFMRMEPMGINNQLLAVCNNLGLAFHHTKNYQKAIEWYTKLFSMSEEVGSAFGMMMANGNLSRVYGDMEDYPQMLVYAQKTLDESTKLGAVRQVTNAHQAVGKASAELGNLTKAIFHLKKADSLAAVIGDLDISVSTRGFLSEFLEKQGNYKEALQYQRLSQQARDSILVNENNKNVEEMRVRFKTEEALKDKELAELEKERANLQKERNRNLAIGIGIIALLIILLAALQITRMRSKRKAELLEEQLKRQEEEAKWSEQLRQSRMSALKSQMNPHFIFNALNSVQSLFYANEKEKASEYLGKFSKLMRSVLEMSDQASVSLYKEMDALTSYLELERLRFENSFNYTISLDEEIDDELVKVPSMLIQPYVENAVKHGLLHKEGNSELGIHITQPDNDHLRVEITDNGIGRKASEQLKAERNPEHRSFASEATAKRLELLNNNRSNKLVVEYEDMIEVDGKPQGTKVSIVIPLWA